MGSVFRRVMRLLLLQHVVDLLRYDRPNGVDRVMSIESLACEARHRSHRWIETFGQLGLDNVM
jgi:hypothetical protein